MKNQKIEITIPVLNEEKRLADGVTRTIEFLQKSMIAQYGIIIADNGSIDRTEEVARMLEKKYPQVRFIKVERKGVGLALKRSWGNSSADIVGYMDVDLATALRHLNDVYSAMERDDVDVVSGSRLLPGSKVINRSLLRELISRTFNFILKLILNVKFSDGMCGFKFIKKAAYDKLVKIGLDNDDWFFCTELLVKAEWSGLKIHEVPVQWKDDGDSRVVIIKTVYKHLKEIMKLRSIKSSLYPLKNHG